MRNSKFVTASFLSLLVLSALLVVQIFWSVVTPIIFALVLLSISYPLYRQILGLLGGRRVIAASLCVTLVFLLVFIPFGYFVSNLTSQALDFYQQSKSSEIYKVEFWEFSSDNVLVKKIKDLAEQYGINVSTQTLIDTIREVLQKSVKLMYDVLGQFASQSLTILLNVVLTFVILFALLLNGYRLKTYLMQLTPLPFDQQEELMRQFGENSRAVFLGTGLINALQGFFGGLGFYLFGMGPGIFWGVLIFLSSFIPAVGTWAIVAPATLYLIAQGQIGPGLLYLFLTSAVFGVLELYIKPKFIGSKSKQHGVLVLLSILGGVQVFGVFGIFYGPLVVAMFLSLAEIYTEHYRSNLVSYEIGAPDTD